MPQSAYPTTTRSYDGVQPLDQRPHLAGDLAAAGCAAAAAVGGRRAASRAAVDDRGRGLGERAARTRATGRAVARQPGEGELLDEPVVEVRAVGELDIRHLLQQRGRARRARGRDSRAIFAPSPATLPAETMRSTGSFGTSPIRTADAGDR